MASIPSHQHPYSKSPSQLFIDQVLEDLAIEGDASRTRMRQVLRLLCSFTIKEGLSLERDVVFDQETIERFCEKGLEGYASRATYRSLLRSVAPKLTDKAPWGPRPVALSERKVARPYSSAEVSQLLEDAEAQPTRRRRRAGRAFLALGLGAGLDGRWATAIRATDVRQSGGVVRVRVGEPAPRQVVVLAEYEERLVALAESACDEYLIGGKTLSKNKANRLVAQLYVPTGHVAMSLPRLRSTWLLAHLRAGTRLPELCQAAGLRTVTVLSDLLPELEPLGADEAAEVLRRPK